ncbi:MAG: DUF5654 family protein [Candidatus Woesearchaeota archaeon]|nr:DUF5654 family protein [Candidatus Woesearchaeota archaeon]
MMGEMKKQTLTLMTAAFAFVAGLVWKDAISAWLAPVMESDGSSVGLTIAALVTTFVVIVLTMLLAKFLGDE